MTNILCPMCAGRDGLGLMDYEMGGCQHCQSPSRRVDWNIDEDGETVFTILQAAGWRHPFLNGDYSDELVAEMVDVLNNRAHPCKPQWILYSIMQSVLLELGDVCLGDEGSSVFEEYSPLPI